MTDAELASVCWVRAVEQGAPSHEASVVPWRDDDAKWASAEALRQVGVCGQGASSVRAPAFVVQRAELAARRMIERDSAWSVPLSGSGPRAWRWLLMLLAVAIAALIVGNVLGSQRINLLAPPVLGLLLWNLLVYLLLPWAWARGPSTWWAQAIERARIKFSGRGASAPLLAARARFAAEWAVATRGQQQARVASSMHASAALLALAVIGSMYLFGLTFDYRAGWDSTWLDAEQVQRTLAAVLAPATALSGITVPSIERIGALRFADGSPGERAAPWIHLYAVTLALFVVLPRVLLAAFSAWRARHLGAGLALPLQEPYFQALLRDGPATAQPVTVLPYSYTLSEEQTSSLPKALRGVLGAGVQPDVRPTLPLGAEDALPGDALAHVQAAAAALFAATATPERETHGAFVQALVKNLAGRSKVLVLVDESSFRQRAGAASDAELRLAQRRMAWQRMLHDMSLPAPVFIDLTP